jgi:hypothetical protein
MRAVATPGQWIWRASGLITAAFLVLVGAHFITRAGQPEYAQPQATVTRTVTLLKPVTSLTVQSYGGSVQITGAPVDRVQITETLRYDAPTGHLSAVPQSASASPVSASPGAAPAAAPGAPAVVQSLSAGHLSVGDPGCASSDCSASFAVTVPADVTVTVTTEGGSISVSGVAGANLDSGGGPVHAAKIGGPLVVGSR